LFLLAPAAFAQGHSREWWEAPRPDDTLEGRLVDVKIQVGGDDAPLYDSPRWNDDRSYFEAFKGRNYSIVLQNRTAQRIGVLIAVDGLNVVDGTQSHLGGDEAMYVLDPYEHTTIAGWRTSLDHVRRFVFVDEKRSYASRTGQANSDMGWIRVLAFREQLPWRTGWKRGDRDERRRDGWGDEYSLNDAPPLPAAPQSDGLGKAKDEARQPSNPSEQGSSGASKPDSNNEAREAPQSAQKSQPSALADKGFPGTGWGDRRYDPVHETRFLPDGAAVDHLVLRYEYASGLLALGIEPWRGPRYSRLGERDREFGFAQPPRR
jgi:hypothetical protein